MMAEEILAIPVSTVGVEQAFSLGEYTLNERRSSMTLENLEAQVCYADWINAERRTRDQYSADEENDDGRWLPK
ncbi:hypothetical protein OROMI_016034 [Orobanche minor]